LARFASFLACEQIRADVAYTRLPVRLISIAGLTVIAPADWNQLASALRAATTYPGPIYFRIGRGQVPDVAPFGFGKAIEHGTGHRRDGVDGAPRSGRRVLPERDRILTGVLDVHSINPLDEPGVLTAAHRSTVVEHSAVGGLGGTATELLAVRHGRPTRPPRLPPLRPRQVEKPPPTRPWNPQAIV
jgi:transketolase